MNRRNKRQRVQEIPARYELEPKFVKRPKVYIKPYPVLDTPLKATIDLRSERELSDKDHALRMKRHQILPEKKCAHLSSACFYWEKTLPKKSRQRLEELVGFYNPDRIQKILAPMTSLRSKLSLRVLDWFVINYSKRKHISIVKKEGNVVNIYDDYRAWLRYWKRSLFDAFRRGVRIFFMSEGKHYATTVAQLNYLYWAEISGVLSYAQTNVDLIECDMNTRIKCCRLEKKAMNKSHRKNIRSDLCKADKVACVVIQNSVIMHF